MRSLFATVLVVFATSTAFGDGVGEIVNYAMSDLPKAIDMTIEDEVFIDVGVKHADVTKFGCGASSGDVTVRAVDRGGDVILVVSPNHLTASSLVSWGYELADGTDGGYLNLAIEVTEAEGQGQSTGQPSGSAGSALKCPCRDYFTFFDEFRLRRASGTADIAGKKHKLTCTGYETIWVNVLLGSQRISGWVYEEKEHHRQWHFSKGPVGALHSYIVSTRRSDNDDWTIYARTGLRECDRSSDEAQPATSGTTSTAECCDGNADSAGSGCSADVEVDRVGRKLRIHGTVKCGCDCDIDITLDGVNDHAEVTCRCGSVRFKVRATRVNDSCIKLETKVASRWVEIGEFCL